MITIYLFSSLLWATIATRINAKRKKATLYNNINTFMLNFLFMPISFIIILINDNFKEN